MIGKVRGFISTNNNLGVKWKIDGCLFIGSDLSNIPNDILDKDVFSWTVNQWEGIIEISTEHDE